MKIFGLQEKGTNFIAEILAGITTFITMSYVLIQCPQLLADGGISQSAAYAAVCMSAFVGCMLMGFIANQPYILSPSIGMIAFFSATLLTDMHYTYHQALALILLAGLIFLLLSVTGLQNAIAKAIPQNMKNALSAGLGIYIALLGLRNAGFIDISSNGTWQLVDFSQQSARLFTTFIMFIGIIIIAMCKRFGLPAPTLLGILASCAIYYIVGVSSGLVDTAELSVDFGSTGTQLSAWASSALFKNFTSGIAGLFGSMQMSFKSILTLIVMILVCSLSNSVESTGVIFATARNSGQLDEGGNFGDLKKTLMANSIATITGSCFGCPALTVAPESNAGISAGGKTGLTAVTAGAMFLMALLFTPLAGAIPSVVTAAAMVYIGILMLNAVKDIDLSDIGESLPAFVTIIVIPFTSSVIDGIALGIIIHVIISICTFKFKSVNLLELIIAGLFAFNYFLI